MEPKLAENYRYFAKVTTHETNRVHPRAIMYGSYTKAEAMRAMVLIGLAVLAAMTLSILVTSRIL